MSDLHLFQNFSSEAYSELLSTCFKSLSKKIQPSESFSQFKTICTNSGIEFSEVEPSLQLFLRILQDTVQKQRPLSQVQDELLNFGMSADQVDLLSKQWEKVHSSLMLSSVMDTIHINPLVDMEWKFGVTSASSQFNTVGNVFLQIKLEVDQGNGKTKTVCFELQLSEFYSFLHEMERARASLDYLS